MAFWAGQLFDWFLIEMEFISTQEPTVRRGVADFGKPGFAKLVWNPNCSFGTSLGNRDARGEFQADKYCSLTSFKELHSNVPFSDSTPSPIIFRLCFMRGLFDVARPEPCEFVLNHCSRRSSFFLRLGIWSVRSGAFPSIWEGTFIVLHLLSCRVCPCICPTTFIVFFLFALFNFISAMRNCDKKAVVTATAYSFSWASATAVIPSDAVSVDRFYCLMLPHTCWKLWPSCRCG